MTNSDLPEAVPHWYVLIAKGHEHNAIVDIQSENSMRDSHKYKFEIFTTLYGANTNNTSGHRRSKMLIPSYVFVRGTEADVRLLKYKYQYLKIPRIAYTNGVLTHIPRVSDSQIASLRIAVEKAGNDVTYFKPGEIDLECGDRVRIVSGPLSGIEGVLISSQGKSGGVIHIEVENLFVVRTITVAAEQMEILSFSKKNNTRLYDNLDKFHSKIRDCMLGYLTNANTEKDLLEVKYYVKRLQNLETGTKNARAKLIVLLLMSYKVLNMENRFALTLQECQTACRELTSDINKAFSLVYMYGCTGDSIVHDECKNILDDWTDVALGKSKMKYDLKKDFEFFFNYYNQK